MDLIEWRYTYPLLEEAGLESWAFDILGWGFSDLESLPQCDVASKRNHLYQFWKSYIKRPMILVGPSLGAAVAIDLAVNHPEAVSKLILIDASVYAEGTGDLAKLPRFLAYAGVALLKSVPLRLYVNRIAFNSISFSTSLDWMNIGRLHCLYPWWQDATVNFMTSGGYNVVPLIKQVNQQTLVIWGEDDKIISYDLALVSFSDTCIMSSCIRPSIQGKTNPIVLLHGFDSSCLEWRSVYPLLEEARAESWAIDILGWGFSDLEQLPSCDVASKRNHLYQFWKSYIKRPMILVGPSLGAAIAIDFAVNHPKAVCKLVLIDASVYTRGLGGMAKMPVIIAKTGLALLKSVPLRLYVSKLLFRNTPLTTSFDWMNIGRLHCLMPWWRDATLSFMASGGYNVTALIKQVKQRTLVIWGEDDQIIRYKLAYRLYSELRDAILYPISDCGHIPHVERPSAVANLILKFVEDD